MIAALVHSGDEESALDNLDTLVQLKEINDLLNDLDIKTQSISFGPSLIGLEKSLNELKPDFIFNLVETVNNTDSLQYIAAGFFEYLKIPYTGCSAVSLAALASKSNQKKIMGLSGLPVPDGQMNKTNQWIVKSDTEHASKGMNSENVVHSISQAKDKILEKEKEFGGHWFSEPFIDGREFNISLLQKQKGQVEVLAPAEILFIDYPIDKPKIVDYSAKWETQSHAFNSTPRTFDFKAKDDLLIDQLKTLSLQCWDLFQLTGAVRVDFRVDELGSPWILEINTNPCLSADAGFMAAAKQSGLSAQDVVKRLIPKDVKKGK